MASGLASVSFEGMWMMPSENDPANVPNSGKAGECGCRIEWGCDDYGSGHYIERCRICAAKIELADDLIEAANRNPPFAGYSPGRAVQFYVMSLANQETTPHANRE